TRDWSSDVCSSDLVPLICVRAECVLEYADVRVTGKQRQGPVTAAAVDDHDVASPDELIKNPLDVWLLVPSDHDGRNLVQQAHDRGSRAPPWPTITDR